MSSADAIILDNISKFYGEVLGVNRVTLAIEPGITSLVGPNGAGKTTLMNIISGLVRPTRGSAYAFGISPLEPEKFYQQVGYCPQFEAFPRGLNGFDLIYSMLRIRGFDRSTADSMSWAVIEKVGMTGAADRKIAGYSKGMRQRIKLALALAHGPRALILDEPLNGLDPLARAEAIALFRQLAECGMHVVISSHIMHEVDMIADRVVMMNGGYVVAEGDIHGVRSEMEDHPMQILIRCDQPALLASQVFQQDSVVEVKINPDGRGLLVATRNADLFYASLNRIILENRIAIEGVAPADDDVHSVYQYVIGPKGGAI